MKTAIRSPGEIKYVGFFVLIIFSVLILVLISLRATKVDRLFKLKQSYASDVSFLKNHIQDELQNADYESINLFLSDWIDLHLNSIVELELTADNGYVLSRYQRETTSVLTITFIESIPYSYNSIVKFKYVGDLSSIDQDLHDLYWAYGLPFLLFATALAFIVILALIKRRLSLKLHDQTIELMNSNYELTRTIDILNASPVIAFLWKNEPGWPVEWVSENVVNLTGCTAQDHMNGTVSYTKLIHPDDLERVSREIHRASEQADSKDFSHEPYRIITENGTEKWVEDHSFIIRETTGVITHYTGIVVDISERIQARAALTQTTANLKSLIDNRHDSIWSVDSDLNYIIFNTFFAAIYKRVYGIQLETGMNAMEILSPENQAFWRPKYEQVLKGENVEFELSEYIGKKEHSFQVMLSPIRTGNTISGVSALSMDITARKQANMKLRENEQIFQLITENAFDFIWTIDMGMNITYASNSIQRLLGYSPEEARQINVSDLYSPSRFQDIQKILGEELAKGNPHHGIIFTTQHLRKDGTEFTAEIQARIIYDETGSPKLIQGYTRDISEQIQAEAEKLLLEKQVFHSQKLESLGILAGGIAHDFNNILVGILGNADLALSSLDPISPAREYVQGINDASRKAADLVKQMLAYSGKGKFSLEPIDLNHLIQDTIQLLHASISKNITLNYNYASEKVLMEGDPSQIRQIIMNLTINASDAIGKQQGLITFTTGKMFCDQGYINSSGFESKTSRQHPILPGTYVFLEVSDSGEGMSIDVIDRIFDPFFTTKFTGRGLGLSAVLGIVSGHRGMVKIYSEEHKGTSFKVLFPLMELANTIPSDPADVSIPSPDFKGRGTFLIADDEESVRLVGKHMIKRLGFDVLTAEDGEKAVEIFKDHADEIVGVLLDLTMPRKDGSQVFQEIRQIKPTVKVILSSGYNEQDATQNFVGKGLAGFIQKPYVSADLIKTIKEIMSNE